MDCTKEDLLEILDGLKDIKQNGPKEVLTGICGNVFTPYIGFLGNLMSSWPEHSGNYKYPVTLLNQDPQDLYLETEDLWDEKTEYGQARYRLLDHMIQQLEDQLNVDGHGEKH